MVKLKEDDTFEVPVLKYILYGILSILILSLILGSYTIIPAGNQGIVFSKIEGVKSQTFDEGFHFKKPIIDEIIKVDVRTQKLERDLASTSKDQQVVSAKIVINYKPNSNQISTLYQTIGLDYTNRIVVPAVDESVKFAMAQYSAENLIVKRQEVSQIALETLRTKIEGSYITIESLNIVNLDFSQQFNQAIEAKVVAEQNVQKEKNLLEQEKIKKETLIVQAEAIKEKSILEAEGKAQAMLLERKAEAEGIELIKEASKGSDEVVALRLVDKWSGVLPVMVTGENSGLLMGFNSIGNLSK